MVIEKNETSVVQLPRQTRITALPGTSMWLQSKADTVEWRADLFFKVVSGTPWSL